VRMTIYQENSSVVESTSSNSAGPRTDKSAIETTVVVDDGQMLVLGGLLKDEYSDGEDRVPGLSKIPYLGALFRSDTRKRSKTNLMVFLRPVVMRGPVDANQLTLDRYDAIRAAQQAAQPRRSSVMDINDSPVLPARPEVPRGAMPPPAKARPPAHARRRSRPPPARCRPPFRRVPWRPPPSRSPRRCTKSAEPWRCAFPCPTPGPRPTACSWKTMANG
jgi:general secretion pathway protein D